MGALPTRAGVRQEGDGGRHGAALSHARKVLRSPNHLDERNALGEERLDVGHQEHKKDRKKAPSKDPNALQMALDSGGIFVCIMLSLALSCAIVAASTIGKDATIDIFMSTERAAREDTQGTYRSLSRW